MKTILAFGASNSRQSINKRFAKYVSSLIPSAEIDFIDLNDYEMPIFSVDREKESGIPEAARRFKAKIRQADGVLISFAEHNSSYTVAFKNLYDWASRIEKSMWLGKPLFFMGTSPGGRGAKSVLDQAITRAQFSDGKVVAQFSLPKFNDNFDDKQGILDQEFASELEKKLETFLEAVEIGVV